MVFCIQNWFSWVLSEKLRTLDFIRNENFKTCHSSPWSIPSSHPEDIHKTWCYGNRYLNFPSKNYFSIILFLLWLDMIAEVDERLRQVIYFSSTMLLHTQIKVCDRKLSLYLQIYVHILFSAKFERTSGKTAQTRQWRKSMCHVINNHRP